jgi:mRNA-degrading endonuclease RelE of RelBE toxin-antitoxin system
MLPFGRRAPTVKIWPEMRYEIILAPEAAEDLSALKAVTKASVKEALETHLRHERTKVNKSRIKRLRGVTRPQYRLRVDEIRVFYDVAGTDLEVLAIVVKAEAEQWLEEFATKAE